MLQMAKYLIHVRGQVNFKSDSLRALDLIL